jgi:lysyl-tRNA synthetase class 2
MAVMGAGELGGAAYTEAGLTAFEIGDEAILDMRSFSLNGPGMKSVRQSVSRLQRRGYTTMVVRHSDVDPAHFEELIASASHWRGDGGDERGFSMALGRLGIHWTPSACCGGPRCRRQTASIPQLPRAVGP